MFLDNGLIDVSKESLNNFGKVHYSTIEHEFNIFYSKQENKYDISWKAYRVLLILYTLLMLDLEKEFKLEIAKKIKEIIPFNLLVACMKK